MKNRPFEELFNETEGQPITYKGKVLKLVDRIKIAHSPINLKITFLSTDSDWKQGITLQTKGEFEINGQRMRNNIVLWEHTAPLIVDIVLNSKDKLLIISNVWDTGDGTMHYGHNGSAMFIDEQDNCRIYYCNDGYPDDDLNDLIFKLEYP